MKDTVTLVVARDGVRRLNLQRAPKLAAGEVAVSIDIEIPDSVFLAPILRGGVKFAERDVATQPVAVTAGAAPLVRQTFGELGEPGAVTTLDEVDLDEIEREVVQEACPFSAAAYQSKVAAGDDGWNESTDDDEGGAGSPRESSAD